MAQTSLSQHQWKDRLVVIIADGLDNPLLTEQVQELQSHTEGLEERKHFIYRLFPSKYATGLEDQPEDWVADNKLYQKLKRSKDSFEVLLIGLDGGVKLRQSKILTIEKLFRTIDSMPMRILEMEGISDE